MPLVVGVSFKKVGKVYYFDPAGFELHEGDFIIAETARGIEFGEVMMEPKDVPDDEIVPPLKKVVRMATPEDAEREQVNRTRERNAYCICLEKIHAHNLPMKLIDAEYSFDGSQVTFFFSAEARVDFRDLVKDLAGALRSKVQLHQVGVRDEAKLFGGLGPCGRVLCCTSFLSNFEPVSMKMAKEQCLFLNPLKFSGICGKLMCCLKYEYETYREAKSRLPHVGTTINTPKGPGKVVELDVIKELLTIQIEDGTVVHFTLQDLSRDTSKEPCSCGCGGCGECSVKAAQEREIEAVAETKPTLAPTPALDRPAQASRPQRPPRRPKNDSQHHTGNEGAQGGVGHHLRRAPNEPPKNDEKAPTPPVGEAKPANPDQKADEAQPNKTRSRNRRRRRKPSPPPQS